MDAAAFLLHRHIALLMAQTSSHAASTSPETIQGGVDAAYFAPSSFALLLDVHEFISGEVIFLEAYDLIRSTNF